MKLALLALVAFGFTATAQTLSVGAPICKLGADPVDPTYRWVPLVTWRLVKTETLVTVTMTTGSKKEVTCMLPAGQVIAYPPGGGNPIVVLCKNELVKGRPEGTEIPRESITFKPPVPSPSRLEITGIPDEIKIGLTADGEIKVIHSGIVKHEHSGTIRHEIIPPPTPAKKASRCGKGCKIAIAVLAGGGAAGAVFATRGGGSSNTNTHASTVTGGAR